MTFAPDVLERLVEKALTYSGSCQVCPCRHFHTVVVDHWQAISMSAEKVVLAVRLASEGDLVESYRRGISLLPHRCPHDVTRYFKAVISMNQWTHTVQGSTRFLMIAAHLFPHDVLDTTGDFAGVMLLPDERMSQNDTTLQCIELFCGGFSGWTQVVHAISERGHLANVRIASDIEPQCVDAYQTSFRVHESCGPWDFSCFHDDLPDNVVLKTDVRNFRWMHLTGREVYDMMMVSAPCQPWSKANYGPGLSSDDGLLTIDALGIAKLLKPRILMLEMVSGMVHHPHYRFIRGFLRFCGYHIRWNPVLNFSQILPQHRERLLIVAARFADDSYQAHSCVTWPERIPPALFSADILMDLAQMPDAWKKATTIPQEVLDLYFQPAMMPKTPNEGGMPNNPFKKSKLDQLRYRVRFPQDIFGCILAQYGSARLLPSRSLEMTGLFGTLPYVWWRGHSLCVHSRTCRLDGRHSDAVLCRFSQWDRSHDWEWNSRSQCSHRHL